MVNVGAAADPVVTRLVEEDKTPWYKKRNLRFMYIFLFLCCMGVEMTSGFDSQLINTLQYAQTFHKCKSLRTTSLSCGGDISHSQIVSYEPPHSSD
jgi:hypothetical protein